MHPPAAGTVARIPPAAHGGAFPSRGNSLFALAAKRMHITGALLRLSGLFAVESTLHRTAKPNRLTGPSILVVRIETGLQRRHETLERGAGDKARLLVVVTDGSATLETAESTTALPALSVAWNRSSARDRLIVDAGTTGHLAAIPEPILARAIGDFLESALLHDLFDQSWQEPAPIDRTQAHGLCERLEAIRSELANPQAGSDMLVVAHLRIVLVQLLRLTGASQLAAGKGSPSHYLQRFRQHVEAGFRSRHPVERYAALLGISHDRLHAICARELNKTPKDLIAERLAREAALALERSTLSIKQLSYSLGFRDPAHFSNFFRRICGEAPARYRKRFKASGSGQDAFSSASYADWP